MLTGFIIGFVLPAMFIIGVLLLMIGFRSDEDINHD